MILREKSTMCFTLMWFIQEIECFISFCIRFKFFSNLLIKPLAIQFLITPWFHVQFQLHPKAGASYSSANINLTAELLLKLGCFPR